MIKKILRFLGRPFYIPKYATPAETTMMQRISISATVIVACLVALSLSAYAYFYHSLSSSSTLTSATYDLTVSADGLIGNDNYFLIENTTDAAATHTFTIQAAPGTTATVGYCKIIVRTNASPIPTAAKGRDGEQLFYSSPIWKLGSGEGKPSMVTYTVTVPAGKTVGLLFVANWGSCAMAPVENGVIDVVFPVDETTDPDQTPEQQPDQTPESTPESTPEPTPESTPEPTPEPTPEETTEDTTEETTEDTTEETTEDTTEETTEGTTEETTEDTTEGTTEDTTEETTEGTTEDATEETTEEPTEETTEESVDDPLEEPSDETTV